MRRSLSAVVALAGAALALGAAAATAAPATTVVMTGLDNPRGLTFDQRGALYVAEAGRGGTVPCGNTPEGAPAFLGSTGAVSRLLRGTQTRISSGLPSLAAADMTAAIGPSDLAFHGRNGLLTIGLGRDPAGRACPGGSSLAWLAKIDANTGAVRLRDDIGAFEAAVNPDGGLPDSNPHSLVKEANGTAVVADAGGNALLRITSRGAFTTLGTFPSRVNGRNTDAVPNSVAVGPDGAYYVGELTGVPFAAGAANVYRVAPPLAPQVWLTGFTSIIDLTFDRAGNLYVLQIASGAGLTPPGALIKVAPDGTRTTVLTDPLLFPTSVVIGRDGDAYVSNCGIFPGSGPYPCTGHVLKVDL